MNSSQGSTDIPADKLTVLADAHGVAPDLRGDFQIEMNRAVFRYKIMKCLKNDTGKVKEQTKCLADKARMLIKAIDGFDKAMSGFDSLSGNPAGVIRAITQYRDAKLPHYLDQPYRGQVNSDAKLWLDATNQAIVSLETMGPIKKNIGNPAFTGLLSSLFDVYETGTHDGEAINAMTGASGWGYYIMHQQELTADGRAIGILRYGKGFDDSAVYEEQVAAHFLLYEPRLLTRLKHDVVGLAFNWASAPLDNSRNEKNIELFYRFPIFPDVDTTLSYQSVIDPALTRDVDHASVFSLRIRMTF